MRVSTSLALAQLRLGFVALGILVQSANSGGVTLVIENGRYTAVLIAELDHRMVSSALQAVVTDNAGGECVADLDTTGVSVIPHSFDAAKPPLATMTALPPRSRMNAVFKFSDCQLKGSQYSLSAEFAVSTADGHAKIMTVPFWGIPAKGGR